MGEKSEYCQGEDQKMQDSERTDLAPVEDSDHPLMPYDYKYLDALRDVIVAHKGIAVVSVLALIASSAAASMGMKRRFLVAAAPRHPRSGRGPRVLLQKCRITQEEVVWGAQ